MFDACSTRRALGCLLLATSAALSARADVLAVGQGEAFTDIQVAIDAAVDGDVILIDTGDYGYATIDDKSLVVLADTAATVQLTGLEIRNLSAQRSVSVRGVEIATAAAPYGPTLTSNAGPVLLEDVNVGPFGRFHITGCAAATLVDCANANTGANYLLGFGATVACTDSNVHVYGGHFKSMKDYGALDVVGGFLFASGTIFEGHDAVAGDPSPFGGCVSANAIHGGYAIRMLASSTGDPEVITQDCTLDPGAPYTGSSTCFGDPGEALIQEAGTYSELEGTAHGFTTTTPVRNGEAYTLSFTGEPGEVAVFLYGLAQAPAYIAQFEGTLLPSAPQILVLGPLPAGGTLDIHGVMNVPAGLAPFTLFEQGAFLAAGEAWLGEPRVAQVLPAP